MQLTSLLSALSLLLAAASLTACGGSPDGTGSAACAAVMDYDGRRYVGHGDLEVIPEATGRTGTGILPGCGGAYAPPEKVTWKELSEVPVGEAVLVGGQLYVVEDEPISPEVRAWFEPVACASRGSFELAGRWIAIPGADGGGDRHIPPPYRVVLEVDDPGLDPGRYDRAVITVYVDRATDPGLTRRDLRTGLWEGGRLRTRVHCVDGRFTAEALHAAAPG